MVIGQVSYYYKPIVGGQEVYIDNLIKVISSAGHGSKVYQSSRRGCVNNECVTSFPLIPVFSKRLGNWDWHLFTFALNIYKREILKNDIIISHYALHSIPFLNHPEKLIILSHGVEWKTEEPGIEDRLRAFIAKNTFNKYTVVANDTHYFRELGCDVAPGRNFFKEVMPGKWFIPNCVDVELFKKNYGIKELQKNKIILLPRQVTVDRGIHIGIKAFHLFLQNHPDCYLYIVGTPTAGDYYLKCISIAQELKIIDRIVFVGFVENKQMPIYYSSSKMCIIPTLRREGTSLSALEAMACGIPTVSTNVAGLRDLPTIQAEPTAEDIARKMDYTFENMEEISRIQHQKVVEVFNMGNWGKAWLQVIDSMRGKR